MGSRETGREETHRLAAEFSALGLGREGCQQEPAPTRLRRQSTDTAAQTPFPAHPQPSWVTLSTSLSPSPPCLSFPACKTEIMKMTFL